MILNNIFKRNKTDIFTLLNMEEKLLFVEVFLKTQDIIPMDFGEADGESRIDIAGTPQYTLVLFLDFFYVFVKNTEFRNSHIESASRIGIDLYDFELSPDSMMKLGAYYTSFRKLSESELKEVKELWRGQINESNRKRVYTLEDAMLYWSESIVRALQVIDLIKLGQAQGVLETEEYIKKLELNLSLNESLVAKYLDMRSSVK